MRSAATTARRGLMHLRNGTLIERVATWWDNARARRRGYREAEVEPGVRLRLHLDSVLANGMIAGGGFEVDERRFVRAYLSSGDVFVDIGANIGLFTLLAAERVGTGGAVYAFEPCAKTYARLAENVALNNRRNVTASHAAVSDRAEARDMITSQDGYDAWNSLAKPTAGTAFSAERVSCVTWDEFARTHDLLGRVTLMKIDVEGWEARVIAGGTESLSRADAPDLLVEFADSTSRAAGSSCRELYDRLQALGYRMFTYDHDGSRLRPEPLRAEYEYANLVATKDPERVSARVQLHPPT